MPKTDPKAKALKLVAACQVKLTTKEAVATDAATERDHAVAVAKDAGATYGEIRQATGLSTTRLTQILKRLREGS